MSWRYPLLYPRVVELDPPRDGLVQWKPWNSKDGEYIGWLGCYEDGSRYFVYSGVDPDDQTRIVHYEGPFGIPGADEERP